jgi:hypothetical protein
VGARINAAITKSELGIAVRESVVRGAQVMDKVDGQWEQFSDKFGLGSARSKQDKKPTLQVIPDPLLLDTEIAKRLFDITDQVRRKQAKEAKQILCNFLTIHVFMHSFFSLAFYPCPIIDVSIIDGDSTKRIDPSDSYGCGQGATIL